MPSNREIRDALIEAVNESAELRTLIEGVPDRVADDVQKRVPVDTGTAKASIEVKARRSPYNRLTTRKVKVGAVQSDDDPAKIGTLEYGRAETDDNGGTPDFAMFRKAAAEWIDKWL
ncbi:hypothetical protein CYL16_01160 [Mycobacterium sp. EPG1]|nr:hypothetical protein CYL16_01160 [Mycobacterium sp. EPG1]